jgi:hypothetical protein
MELHTRETVKIAIGDGILLKILMELERSGIK